MGDVVSIKLTAFSDSVIASFHLISPDAAEIKIVGPQGPPGVPGVPGPPGSGSIASTTNLIKGDGAGAGLDSTIDPANVVRKQTAFATPTTINTIVACLQAAGLCASIAIAAVFFSVSPAHATNFGDVTAGTDVSTLWVPPSRTVNGHALSANVSVTASDLSLVIGTNVEAWSANLDSWSALAPSSKQDADGDLTALAALTGTNTIYYRSAADTWTAVTVGTGLTFSGGTLSATGGGGSVDDTAFASSWNGVTGTAPSKNAVYDEIHAFDTDDNGKVNVLDMGAGIVKTSSGGVISAAVSGTDYAPATSGSSILYGNSGGFSNVTIGSGLSFSGGTLSASGGGSSYWNASVQVSGSNFTTTSTSLVNITGLTYAASANTTYEVEVHLRVQSSDNSGLQVGIQYSAAGATVGMIAIGNNGTSSATTAARTAFNSTLGPFASLTNTDSVVWGKATVITGANAGNITIQVDKISSGTATVYIGSIMNVR